MPPVTLTPSLFERLLESLTRAGFPTVERLRPGLSDDEMDTLTQPLGITLPLEARIWWRRQNGGKNALVGSYRDFASLQEMIDETLHLREVHAKGFADAGLLMWKDNLIPMVGDTTQFGCDCSVAAGEPSPIWVLVPSDAEDLQGPVLPSLGALVEAFTLAVDEGIYEYIPEHDVAVINFDEWLPVKNLPYGMP
jgi:hypothetical protein